MYEWMYDFKEFRLLALQINSWTETIIPFDWMKEIKYNWHKEAREDLKSIWLNFMKLIDCRSSQFNDKLICIMESLTPFPVGLQFSFSDHEEIIQDFFGQAKDPGGIDAQGKILWDLGPKLLLRILKLKQKTSPEIKSWTLEDIRMILIKEYRIFQERSSWAGCYKLADDPWSFWNFFATKQDYFPHLAILTLEIYKICVSNAGVERSFKTTSLILTDKRNRLLLPKLKEEMLILYNKDTSKSLNWLHRILECHDSFVKLYKKCNLEDEILEKEIIHKIDLLEDPRIKEQYKSKISTSISSSPSKQPKKTKIFQIIQENPDYLPKKRKI